APQARNHGNEICLGDAAVEIEFPIEVRNSFNRVDRGEVLGAGGRDLPLDPCEVGNPAQPDLPVAPGLCPCPLDKITAVLDLLRGAEACVTVRAPRSSWIGIDNRVARGAPESRVRCLEDHI